MHRLHSERLQSERQEWHADLDSLLEGNFASEDLDLAITLAKCVHHSHSPIHAGKCCTPMKNMHWVCISEMVSLAQVSSA